MLTETVALPLVSSAALLLNLRASLIPLKDKGIELNFNQLKRLVCSLIIGFKILFLATSGLYKLTSLITLLASC